MDFSVLAYDNVLLKVCLNKHYGGAHRPTILHFCASAFVSLPCVQSSMSKPARRKSVYQKVWSMGLSKGIRRAHHQTVCTWSSGIEVHCHFQKVALQEFGKKTKKKENQSLEVGNCTLQPVSHRKWGTAHKIRSCKAPNYTFCTMSVLLQDQNFKISQ